MNVTLMALVFGGKASTGVVVPLLCAGDVLAVVYYRRHVQWPAFWKLLPWMLAGVLIGVFIGKELNEAVFRKMMAVIIVLTAAGMVALEFRKAHFPDTKVFAASMGLAAGITTMLGNLAGAFSNIYFLAMHMAKNSFIGTAACVFLVVNFFKLPFQIFFWKNINTASLLADVWLLPALLAGFWAGVKLVAGIKETAYRTLVIALTLAGAVLIFFK